MDDLLILGDGVHAMEMAEIVARINRERPRYNLLGFLVPDSHKERTGQERADHPILGSFADVPRYPGAMFVSDNAGHRFAGSLPREQLATLIDPSAFVSKSAQVGRGCVVYPHCYIGFNAKIGDLVFCLAGCVINHDDVIEGDAVLASRASLAGYVHVESGCYLGQACTIRQNTRIGRNSIIGMGAVVLHDVPPNSIMVGNPARKLRDREEEKPRHGEAQA